MRQQDLVFCVAIQTCRASRRRTERYPATRCLHRPAASVFRSSAAAYAPVRMQLTKSSLRKAFSLSFPQLLAQTIAIKASTPKVGSGSLSTSSCFGRKSPDTPWVFSWYAETRRHRCKHTCGLLRLSLPFRCLEMVPIAVCTLHVRCWSCCWSLARSPRLQRG